MALDQLLGAGDRSGSVTAHQSGDRVMTDRHQSRPGREGGGYLLRKRPQRVLIAGWPQRRHEQLVRTVAELDPGRLGRRCCPRPTREQELEQVPADVDPLLDPVL
jgi:hypothetical protein